jgi:hypothetical protein
MYIAFKQNPTKFSGKAICWWTASDFYHCEIVFTCGLSFSASPSENKTRFKTIDYKNTSDWILIPLPFDAKTEEEIFKFCCDETNCGYDWAGIFLTQIIPLSIESRTRWFCSEIGMRALQIAGWFENEIPHHFSPGELFDMFQEQISKQLTKELK